MNKLQLYRQTKTGQGKEQTPNLSQSMPQSPIRRQLTKAFCQIEEGNTYRNIQESFTKMNQQRSKMDSLLTQMNELQLNKISQQINESMNERKKIHYYMPIIRVSSQDPEQQHIRKAFQIIKEQNMDHSKRQQSEVSKHQIVKMGTQSKGGANLASVESQILLNNDYTIFKNIDPSQYIQVKNETNIPAQQVIDQNKQIQILVQKQLNRYKTLKEVNDQLFYTPKNYQQQNNQRRIMNTRYSAFPTFTSSNGLQTPRVQNMNLSHIQLSTQQNSPRLQSNESLKRQNISASQSRGTFENYSQKLHCLNDKYKLRYDKDSFIRFYKFKQSLQSQNILFNQLQQQQLLNKGSQQVQSIENCQDFFVNVKYMKNDELIRYISVGSSLIYLNNKGLLICGKSIDRNRGLVLLSISEATGEIEHVQEKSGSKIDIFQRYGQEAHIFQNKIILFGGELCLNSGQQNIRTLLGDLIFFDPQKMRYKQVQFSKPLKKLRAVASAILGKYFYYFGGLQDNGQTVNNLVRINLTQDQKTEFNWKNIDLFQFKNELKNIPFLSYSKMIPVLYDQRLEIYENEIENFSLKSINNEINWEQVQNYISVEGLYLFGGLNQESVPQNDLYVIKISSKRKHILLKPQTYGKQPQARYMHTFTYFKPSNCLILAGGRNDFLKSRQALDDMYVLYLDSLTWNEVTFCNQRIHPRFNFNSIVVDTKLIILGGQTEGFKIAHDYEIIELDQEINFMNHASKYLFKKMAAFIRENFRKNSKNSLMSNDNIKINLQNINHDQNTATNNNEQGKTDIKFKTRDQIFNAIMRKVKATSQIVEYTPHEAQRMPPLISKEEKSTFDRKKKSVQEYNNQMSDYTFQKNRNYLKQSTQHFKRLSQ